MKKYLLTIYVVEMITEGNPYFNEEHISFEKSSIDKAIESAKYLLEERKKEAIEKINNLFKNNKITKEKKEELIQKYPKTTKLVETITHSIPTE